MMKLYLSGPSNPPPPESVPRCNEEHCDSDYEMESLHDQSTEEETEGETTQPEPEEETDQRFPCFPKRLDINKCNTLDRECTSMMTT